jgi:hypothetical protein
MTNVSETDPVYRSRFKIIEEVVALPVAAVVTMVGIGAYFAGNPELALYLVAPMAMFVAPELPYLRQYLEALTRRRVALQVDREGIAFGARPGLPITDSEFVPWSAATAVLLWRGGRGLIGARYVGVQRRGGPSPMWTMTSEPLTARISGAFRPWHKPRRETGDHRRVHGWRLDRKHFKTVVAQVAPHVTVVDTW